MADPRSSTLGPVPPDPKFLVIQQAIEKDPTDSEATLQVALETLKPEEQEAFLKWLSDWTLWNTHRAVQRVEPLSNDQVQTVLVAVDWASPSSIADFERKVYGPGDRTGISSPKYLGQDNSYRYYLELDLPLQDVRNDLRGGAVEHDSVVEMRSISGSKPPFQYGFRLGVLSYVFHSRSMESVDLESLEKAPFFVYLDVVKKGVWLVMTTSTEDELGVQIPLDERCNPWDHLPSPQNGRVLFKAMPIFRSIDEIWRVSEDHALFSPFALSSTFPAWLTPWLAEEGSVNTAIANAGRGAPAAA
ncbi:uncharacterized protein B0I36DRAFT_363437 [Microdochium trichocladiopsis]|uniref:Uncharacterized protein n=1 Tax=Microdochium trichocladiopsis TaxID=1682393 RepID=A0A9P8Y1P6_9PEZI|nr:uncharacterized protein B0I36DRAFT_363437 [Microdochium trichocladiopsis]KAH7028814.1 hypothetical protein B0I36DRAFT_363437 [Microdochium trichocladiopsis]